MEGAVGNDQFPVVVDGPTSGDIGEGGVMRGPGAGVSRVMVEGGIGDSQRSAVGDRPTRGAGGGTAAERSNNAGPGAGRVVVEGAFGDRQRPAVGDGPA